MDAPNIYEMVAQEMAVLKFSSPAKPGQFKAPAEISSSSGCSPISVYQPWGAG